MMIRTLLCEDHAQMRAAIRALLERELDIEVIAEAATARDLIDQMSHVQPDVVLLDVRLPDGNGLGTIPELLATSPATHVVVLTSEEDPSYLRQALALGAHAYLLKESAGEELPTVIREVMADHRYIDPHLRTLAA